MADKPWQGHQLTKGQVEQKLYSLSCKKIKDITNDASMWIAPTSNVFTISLADCDSGYLEGIVDKLQEWAEEKRL